MTRANVCHSVLRTREEAHFNASCKFGLTTSNSLELLFVVQHHAPHAADYFLFLFVPLSNTLKLRSFPARSA